MRRTIIRGIDPGTTESAYVDWDGTMVLAFGKHPNDEIVRLLDDFEDYSMPRVLIVAIEQIAGYGMAVGKDVFRTCWWSGRFFEVATNFGFLCLEMERREVKMRMCGNPQAKDKNIIVALVDRFDPMREFGQYGKGTKKNPGPFFGFSKDVWQAFALAVTVWDRMCKGGDRDGCS